MQAAAQAGLRAVICNRPDGDGSDPSLFTEIERAATGQGLQIRDLPAESGGATDEPGVALGTLMAGLPKLDGTRPSALAWYLKERVLPPLYWQGMLKGREWLAQPEMRN